MRKWFDLLPFGGYNLVSRTLLSPLFTTAALYKRLHASSNPVINDMLLIQDVYIPLSTSKQFVTFLQSGQLFGIEHEKAEPIWLCPIRSCSTSQKLSPHCVEKNTDDQQSMMIDFGVWTHRHSWKLWSASGKKATKLLEEQTNRLGGRKMFYAASFYSRELMGDHLWHSMVWTNENQMGSRLCLGRFLSQSCSLLIIGYPYSRSYSYLSSKFVSLFVFCSHLSVNIKP